MEDAIFEFVAIYGVLCMCFSQNTVNTSVFLNVVQKHCISISNMLSCQSVANSGVFATFAFLVVAKTT